MVYINTYNTIIYKMNNNSGNSSTSWAQSDDESNNSDRVSQFSAEIGPEHLMLANYLADNDINYWKMRAHRYQMLSREL